MVKLDKISIIFPFTAAIYFARTQPILYDRGIALTRGTLEICLLKPVPMVPSTKNEVQRSSLIFCLGFVPRVALLMVPEHEEQKNTEHA